GTKAGPGAAGGFPPAEVSVFTVDAKPLPVSFEYTGQTLGSREIEVRARISGVLLKRNFVEGKPVKKGESLYTIDPAPFAAALARSDADVAAAAARHDQAQRNAARLKPLWAEKAVSQKDFDDAVSAEAIGAADLKAARGWKRILEKGQGELLRCAGLARHRNARHARRGAESERHDQAGRIRPRGAARRGAPERDHRPAARGARGPARQVRLRGERQK